MREAAPVGPTTPREYLAPSDASQMSALLWRQHPVTVHAGPLGVGLKGSHNPTRGFCERDTDGRGDLFTREAHGVPSKRRSPLPHVGQVTGSVGGLTRASGRNPESPSPAIGAGLVGPDSGRPILACS